MSSGSEEDFRAWCRYVEALLKDRADPPCASVDRGTTRLMPELSALQIELELLDNELLRTRIELEDSHAVTLLRREELRDTVGQQLTAIGYMVDNLEQELISQGVPVTARLRELRSALSEADGQVRFLSRDMPPPQLSFGGLPVALRGLAQDTEKRFGIPCSCECGDEIAVDEPAASAMLRIAREAVNYAVKHASPNHVCIVVERRSNHMVMTVRDDGIGMREDAGESDALGLHIMAHRAEMAGGRVAVERGQDGGTVVACTVPTGPR